MSQQHPTFPPHLPRGLAASAMALPARAAPTTMLRSGVSPTIQIPSFSSVPPAPSVPTVSGSVTGLPSTLVRNPVISAIRTGLQPTTTVSGSVSLTEHPRTSLIVQGPAGAGTSIQGQPLQITLTQRVNPGAPTLGMSLNPSAPTISMSEAMKLSGKTVQVAQTGLLQPQKVSLGAQPASGTPAGMGLMPQIQHQAVLVASKAVSAPAISISPLTAPMPTATVVTPVSTSQIPIAKVTSQRQQMALTPGLTVQMMTTTGSELTHMPNLSTIASQASGNQLLQLSQTPQRSVQTGNIVATSSAAGGAALTTTVPTGGAASMIPSQGERLAAPAMFNLTAANPGAAGQGQEGWLSHFIYPQSRTQLVPAPANPSAAIPRPQPVANTFFVPRPGADHNKIATNPTPNLTASLSHPMPPSQPTVLFNTNMVVEGLRPSQPLVAASVGVTMAVASSSVTVTTTDSKPVISLSVSSTGHPAMVQGVGIGANPGRSADPSLFTNTPSLSLQSSASLAAGSTSMPVLTSSLGGNSVLPSQSARATVASSLITMPTVHQSQPVAGMQPQAPGTPGGGGGGNNSNSGASPRPSILRKRNVDGVMVTPKKPNFSMTTESHSPRPEPVPSTNIGSPKTPATENSQSSTDTALSSNDGGTPTQNGDRVKPEPLDGAENGSAVHGPGSGTEATPRKRARKQLFDLSRRKMNEDNKGNTSSEDDHDDDGHDNSKPMDTDGGEDESIEEREEFIDEEGVRWTKERTKPYMSLMTDNFDWKPRFNHFQRYSDVKSKDDRNPTLNELISQRGIVQKASGWRLYYVSSQVEDVMQNEEDLQQRLEKLKERLDAEASSRPANEQDFHRLLELARGNLQRCKVVRQQLLEANTSMLNLLKHEPKIKEIITKNLAKRTIKKKERC